jgi:hypothetical protein
MTMSMRSYKGIVRKLNAAYLALQTADSGALFNDSMAICGAMDQLRLVPDMLRIQVCRDCGESGYYTAPDDPNTSLRCSHPTVPRFDVRTGGEQS